MSSLYRVLEVQEHECEEKGGDARRSGLAMSKLFGALGHVHNPFSMDLHKDHDGYKQDNSSIDFRTMNFQLEMAKAEANLMAYSLIARIQKS